MQIIVYFQPLFMNYFFLFWFAQVMYWHVVLSFNLFLAFIMHIEIQWNYGWNVKKKFHFLKPLRSNIIIFDPGFFYGMESVTEFNTSRQTFTYQTMCWSRLIKTHQYTYAAWAMFISYHCSVYVYNINNLISTTWSSDSVQQPIIEQIEAESLQQLLINKLE